MTDVKICGIRNLETLNAVRTAGARHVGFVFFAKSPRNISLPDARGLAEQAGGLVRVGLFVDADDELIAAAAPFLDALQLHGAESPARAAELRSRFGLKVWKALGVSSRADVAGAAQYRGAADLILFDAKPPEEAAIPGGRGVRFDWQLLKGVEKGMNWGLAGGLSPQNVADAIAATGAPLVDASSGVEDAPGQKSAAKIAAFMEAVNA